MTRRNLSALAAHLKGSGICIREDQGGFLAFCEDDDGAAVLFTVSRDDLFDADGNRFEDDLP